MVRTLNPNLNTDNTDHLNIGKDISISPILSSHLKVIVLHMLLELVINKLYSIDLSITIY